MANLAALRIKREFKQYMCSEEFGPCSIKVELLNDSWTNLRGEIDGPPDTPYEGGKFLLEIKVPDRYPFEPPNIRFLTRIWHPNISSATGDVCVLKDSWAAALTVHSVLMSLQALLGAAEPDDPQDAVVAAQFKDQYDLFVLTAKHWTNAYAGGPHTIPDCDAKVQRLRAMGYDEQDARHVLSKENWNLKNSTKCLSRSLAWSSMATATENIATEITF